jgi:hypothetical protein
MEENLPREIDCDLIKEMRAQGRSFEASLLLDAFHKSKEKEKEQVKKEIRRDDWKKTQFKKMKKKKEPLYTFDDKDYLVEIQGDEENE